MKISIIVPAYNCQSFIARCIESIVKQTWNDFEIIIINDGSSDNTLDIIKTYQKEHSSLIKVISQSNSGASAARNKGIEMATGTYLTFVDSDDFLAPDFLETMMKACHEEDLCISGYLKTDSMGNILYTKTPEDIFWSLFKYSTNWANLYKTEFIMNNHIRFPNIRIGEDIDFTLQCVIHHPSYKIVKYAGYNYCFNDDSITNTIQKKQNINQLKELLYLMDEQTIAADYHNAYYLYYYFIKTSVFNLYMQRENLNKNDLMDLFENEFKIINDMNCLENKKFRWIWMRGEECRVNILVNAFLISQRLHSLGLLINGLKRI